MKVKIYSRKAIEELLQSQFPDNVAVISFYDPPSKRTGEVFKPVDYKGKAERVFTIPIHDIDIEILEDYGLTFDTYFPEVNSLAEYIHQAHNDGLDIICQCEYGQSRSAACAAAILEHYYKDGISVFADYRYYPNQLVYNKVKKALDKEAVKKDTAIYAVHSDDMTVKEQLSFCRQFAKENNLTVVKEYCVHSNKQNDKSEELSLILNSGIFFGSIIVYSLDVLQPSTIKELGNDGVQIISVTNSVSL